jgi:acetolactate synthase-1/2/3 large subunit
LVVVIIRDDGYGMIKWKQDAMGFPNYGLDFNNPDFVLYARAYGINGVRIERTQDFLPVLSDCIAARGVHVIEVPVDYSENRALTQELKRRASSTSS